MEKSGQSVIAKDVEITGTVKSGGSVHIDGKLDGELICQGDARVGQGAQIKGNLNANAIVVEGSIQGNLTAKDKIEMKSTAKVVGDIQSKRLAVEDGVTFMGKSEVNPGGSTDSAAAPAAARSGESSKSAERVAAQATK